MAEIELIKETPISMAELREKLEVIRKNHELGFRANKTWEYLGTFAEEKLKEIEEKKKKLQELNIIRLKDTQVIKILDISPKDIDGLKAVFASENVALKPEDMKRVVECIQ